MQTQNQDKFIKLLYEMKKDMEDNIVHTEGKLDDYRDKLQQIKSAIVNLEAEGQNTTE